MPKSTKDCSSHGSWAARDRLSPRLPQTPASSLSAVGERRTTVLTSHCLLGLLPEAPGNQAFCSDREHRALLVFEPPWEGVSTAKRQPESCCPPRLSLTSLCPTCTPCSLSSPDGSSPNPATLCPEFCPNRRPLGPSLWPAGIWGFMAGHVTAGAR
jgi:hypothetical protein